jgi:hypothetical protein
MISLPNIPTLFRAHSQAVDHMSGDVKHVVPIVVDSELDISLNTIGEITVAVLRPF